MVLYKINTIMVFDYEKCLFTFIMENVSIGLNINNVRKKYKIWVMTYVHIFNEKYKMYSIVI